jgi:biopolymer transport protein ExbD
MLVLLIIFLITVPVVGHNVPLTLPKERSALSEAKPGNINLSVNREGDVFWDDRAVPDMPTLFEKLKIEAVKVPQPTVRLRGDENARYEQIGRVVFTLQRAGMQKIGFITEPPVRAP